MMMDHILTFADETSAHAALDPLGLGGTQLSSDGKTSTPYWAGGVLASKENFRGISADAVWDRTDPLHPVLVTPEQVLPGFWVGVATDDQAKSDALKALPGDACRVILNREASRPGNANWSFLYISPAVVPSDLATVHFSPIFAGSTY
jgi:hypothetical protein